MQIEYHMYRSIMYKACVNVLITIVQDLNFLYTGYWYTTKLAHEYSDSKTFKLRMSHEALILVVAEYCWTLPLI